MANWPAKILAAILVLVPMPLLALATKGEAVVVVADTRGLSGWKVWSLNLYNDSRLLFALLTVTLIPLFALIMGRLMAWLMARLGVNLRTRQLIEH